MRMSGYGGLVAMGVRAAVVLLLVCVGSAAHASKRVALVSGVLAPIDFNNQALFTAYKVDDVGTERRLPP